MTDPIANLIADVLQLRPDAVNDDLGFNTAPNWDSLNHINLMLALEAEFGIEIPDDDVIELTTVGAIRRYVTRVSSGP